MSKLLLEINQLAFGIWKGGGGFQELTYGKSVNLRMVF